jgi:signal transduction histidine kinase/Tfp pilus assembly protein PilF
MKHNTTTTITESVEKLLQQAQHYEQQGELDAAMKLLDNIVTVPQTMEPSFVYGEALRLKGWIIIYTHSNPIDASSWLHQALQVFEAVEDKINIARVTGNIGAMYFHASHFEESLTWHNKALVLDEANNNQKGIAVHVGNIALIFMHRMQYTEAITWFKRALQIHLEVGNKRYAATQLDNIALLRTSFEPDLEEAFTCLNQAVELYQEIGDKRGEASTCESLGTLFESLGEQDRALDYYYKAHKYYETMGMSNHAAMTLSNIGLTYARKGNHKKGLEVFRRAESSFGLLETETLATIILNIGVCLLQDKQFDEAYKELYRALEIFNTCTNIIDSYQITVVKGHLGVIYATQSTPYYNRRRAIRYLREAITKLQEQNKLYCATFCATLAMLYEDSHQWKKALTYWKQHHALISEMKGEEVRKQAEFYAFEQKIAESEMKVVVEKSQRLEAEKREQALIEKNIALLEAQNLKMELLSIVSHDLKNPLSFLRLSSELIANNTTDEPYKEIAQKMHQNVQVMENLVVRFLDGTARTLGSMEPHLERISLSSPIMDTVTVNELQASRKNQTISCSLEQLEAEIDVSKFRQIVDNLLSNAIKYSYVGTEIHVELRKSSRTHFCLSIRDNGQGMSNEDLEKKFTFGQRMSAKPTAGESSHGIGLAVVQNIVTLHGGRFWAESEGRDCGATFFVEIPFMQP